MKAYVGDYIVLDGEGASRIMAIKHYPVLHDMEVYVLENGRECDEDEVTEETLLLESEVLG